MPAEKEIMDAARDHPGGLGDRLTEEGMERIIFGAPRKAENKVPFRPEKFLEGGRKFMENHPIGWFLK